MDDHSYIFVTGGHNYINDIFDDCEYYDPRQDKWYKFASMKNKRSLHNSVALYERLFVTGGRISSTGPVSTMEIYNPRTDSWAVGAVMGTKREGHGMAVLNGEIYVAGGSNGTSYLNSVEKLDPFTCSWYPVASTKYIHFGCSLIEFDGTLFCIGGASSTTTVGNTLERFDPRVSFSLWPKDKMISLSDLPFLSINLIKIKIFFQEGKWTDVAHLLHPRMWFGAALLDDKIYVAGGWDGSIFFNSVERYDVKNTWEDIASLEYRR